MGLKDFFRKNDADDATQPNVPAPAQPSASAAPPLGVSTADVVYLQVVSSANQMIADQIAAGGAAGMSPEHRSWFTAHAGQPVSPTKDLGVTWYADVGASKVQLVDHSMLEMTGMDDPANQPGIQELLAERPNAGSPAMLARKERSNAELRHRGAPLNEQLPCIEDASQTQQRTSHEAAQRAVCLMAVAIKAEVFNEGDVAEFQPRLQDIITSHGIEQALTPLELAFVNDLAPERQTAVQFIWRYEGLWTLLWALGFIDELDYPTAICDVPRAVGTVRDLGPEGFMAAAELRPIDELLDAADLIYRLHWAVRDARINNRDPLPGVEAGAVMERHHTLNWLIGYGGQDWDDISTDT